jgi:hypothetical protein
MISNFELMENQQALRQQFGGAEGRDRTDTMSPSPVFETGASTNSTTPAERVQYSKVEFGIKSLLSWHYAIKSFLF